MTTSPKPSNEEQRLLDLEAYDVLDTPAEEAFDAITRLASRICRSPIALISLVDEERQWFKSRIGLAARETSRDVAFCAHAIMGESLMVVSDALADPRFAANPLVLGDPQIRFYAGMPLRSPSGSAVGTLCVMDREPRSLSDDQQDALRLLGEQVVALLELRRVSKALSAQLQTRLAVEGALRSKEALFKEVYDNVPAVIFALDRDGIILLENGARNRDSDPTGLSAFDVFEGRPKILENVRRALGGESFRTTMEDHGRVMEISHHFVPDSPSNLAVVGVALDITEVDLLRRALQREYLRSKLLSEVAAAANAATTDEQALAAALSSICSLTNWPVGHAWLREKSASRDLVSGQKWHFQDPTRGLETLIRNTPRRLPVDFGLPWRALRLGLPLLVTDITGDERFVRAADLHSLDLNTGLFLPVPVDEEIEAVLEFFFPASESAGDLVDVLQQVGLQIGHALKRHQTERTLKESEETYRDLVDQSLDFIGTHDLHGRVLSANLATARALGARSGEELVGRLMTDFIPEQFHGSFQRYLRRIGEKAAAQGLMAVIGPDGVWRIWEYRNSLRDAPGSMIVRTSGRDVTERVRLQRDLSDSERRYRALFEANLVGVFQATPEGQIVEANRACFELFGYSSREELMSVGAAALYDRLEARTRMIDELLKSGGITNFEQRMRRKDGSAFWGLVNATLLSGQEKRPMIHGNVVDISAQKEAEERSAYLAMHDSLTGLPNRMLFMDRLRQGLAQSARTGAPLSVLFLDLDGFKAVNDHFGHNAGDAVLVEIAARLAARLRSSDTIARMGGDEFAILLSADLPLATSVAGEIHQDISAPIGFGEAVLAVGVSIGIAVWAESLGAETLLERADEAMYEVKRSRRSRIASP